MAFPFTEQCAKRILKENVPDVSISGMGLMELNTTVLAFYDKICINIRPLVEINGKEVILALPLVLPEQLVPVATERAEKEFAEFKASGIPVTDKLPDEKFPLNELLIKLREQYTTVVVNAECVVYMAAVLETIVIELFKVAGEYAKRNKRSQIGRNDIKWAVQNDSDLQTIFSL